MSAEKTAVTNESCTTDATEKKPQRAPYEAPRLEKRRSVARVTLVSGMGQMGVGVIGMM